MTQHTCNTTPPKQGADAANPRACATAFPCAVRQGLLFVRPKPLSEAAADESTIPIVDEFEDTEWVTQVRTSRRGFVLSPGCRMCSCMHSTGNQM
jgi:phenylpropionate dioxygenase-like ring-hydroxylating dioxygenase large terminal subunit